MRSWKTTNERPPRPGIRRVCIIGASGKLGRHLARHCLDRGYEVIGVCPDRGYEVIGAASTGATR